MSRLNNTTHSTLLDRHSQPNHPELTQGQLGLDSAVAQFSHQAADPANLLSMTVGSFAFRYAKILGLEGAAAAGLSRIVPRFALNGTAAALALSAEVTAFRGTSNLLSGRSLSETFEANGWKSSYLDFMILKSVGHLGAGSPVLSNFAQSNAMVLGHELSASLGWTAHDHRSYVERLAEAQATTLALNAGSALFGVLTGGRTHSAERALEARLEALQGPASLEAHSLGARSPELLSMGAEASSEPPSGKSKPPRVGREGRTEGVIRGVGRRLTGLVPDIDLNAFVDPSEPVPALPTRAPAEPIRSVQEGIDRSRALGHDQETLSFLRWGAHQLRGHAEVQQQFLRGARALFDAQEKLRGLLEPILEKLPRPNWETLNRRARAYLDKLNSVEGAGSPQHAEFLVLRAQVERLQLESLADYERLSDDQLRDRGIEPEAIDAIGHNAHAYSRAEIDARLNHPLLRDLPETAALRSAYDQYFQQIQAFNEDLATVKREVVKPLRARIATTTDVARRAELEKEIKASVSPFTKRYWTLTGEVNAAMRGFLSNPAHARVFLVENALQTSQRTAVQGMTPRQMADYLQARADALPPEQAALVQVIRDTAKAMELVAERGFLARAYYGALRIFNKDRHSPQILRGRYERALTDFIEGVSPSFWALERPTDAALEEAVEAQTSYFREYYGAVKESRAALDEIEAANERFWGTFDQEVKQLVLDDLERQVAQASAFIDAWREKIGNDFEDRGSTRNESYAEEYDRLRGKAAAAIGEVRAGATLNSRDLNRKREAALQRVQDLFVFANRMRERELGLFKLAKRFGVWGNGNGKHLYEPLVPVSTMALPYVTKFQNRWYSALGESLRVVLPVIGQTAPRVLRLMNGVKRQHSFSTQRHIMATWASAMARGRKDVIVADPHTAAIAELTTTQFAGDHNGWPDFALGPTPGAGMAQQGGPANSRLTPLILAKEGLGKLIGPLFESAIDILTESVGDSAQEFDKSVSRAARSLVIGDVGNANLSPGNTAAYDALTMSVVNQLNPFRFSPFEGTSELLSLPQGGRSFRISERALAISGRPQNLLLTTSLNSFEIYPKPDRPTPLRAGRMVTVTEWLPTQALGGYSVESANWLRTHWYLMASTPEYHNPIPSIQRMFRPFEKAVDASSEATLEQMFGGANGVYPNAEGSRSLRERAEAAAVGNSTEASARAQRASRTYDLRLIETHLDRALLELRDAGQDRSLQGETAKLTDIVERRKAHLFKISWKLEKGLRLSEAEQREWEALRASALHPEQNMRARQVLDLSLAFQRAIPAEAPASLARVYGQRLQQLRVALARTTLGEALTPAEELLLREMEAAFTQPESEHADRVVSALRDPLLTQDALASLELEEGIREETRRLARLLPGGGRGTIDAVQESVHDRARVAFDAAGEVVAGKKSLPRTLHQAARFVAHCLHLGFVEASIDLLSGNRWDLYTAHSAWVGRSIMSPMRARIAVDAETLHTIENLRIQARREGRPITVASTHESWTDITTIMTLIPEARFNAKFELVFTGVLAPPLIGGRHNLISRGDPEKSRRQMERAGRRMLRYGVATVNFHGGTRSKTGTVSPGKKGSGYLAVDTNSLVLALSLHGTQQVMPLSWGSLLTKGGGVDRRVDLRATVIDPRSLEGSDELAPDQRRKRTVARVNEAIQARLIEQDVQILANLHELAQAGNVMARAQLNETLAKLEPGMQLVREGRLEEAQRWAEGDGKKSQGMKTDFDFLRRVTRWWDGSRETPVGTEQ